MVSIMKKLLLLIILCSFTAAAVEIENEALIKEAIGIIGEYIGAIYSRVNQKWLAGVDSLMPSAMSGKPNPT